MYMRQIRKDFVVFAVGKRSARCCRKTWDGFAGLAIPGFCSLSHNPEGFEGAPPAAKSSDRRSRAGTWLIASKAQQEALVPTRVVGSNPAPATKRKYLEA